MATTLQGYWQAVDDIVREHVRRGTQSAATTDEVQPYPTAIDPLQGLWWQRGQVWDELSIRPLAGWLLEIRARLIAARNIETTFDRLLAILRELIVAGFTVQQRGPAEAWILRGNWQWKSPKILLLADFFPTEEQLREVGQQVVPIEWHQSELRRVRQSGFRMGVDEGWRKATSRFPRTDAEREELRTQHKEVMGILSRSYVQDEHVRALELALRKEQQRSTSLERQLMSRSEDG